MGIFSRSYSSVWMYENNNNKGFFSYVIRLFFQAKKNHQNFLRFIIYDKWWWLIWQKSIRKRPSFSMIMMMANNNNNNKNNKKEMCFLAIDQTNKQTEKILSNFVINTYSFLAVWKYFEDSWMIIWNKSRQNKHYMIKQTNKQTYITSESNAP